ncbi:Cytochrome c-type biogenesis protein CcmG/DsbE, thiol:disulfide oxidoreductase [hydrothermal vent metagenome]|uniref:Cytochrome c-type biogenesis protein CcmG/DsbE, thiol:disulfide oxidoreductase n=1 Tax=hydrothermal vent metagenome TaxID=652676 RepID=A0A3B0UZ28_9ZZZZ
MNKKTLFKALIPLIIFLSLAALLFSGIGKDTRLLPSVLINKPVPQFSLPSLITGKIINNESLKGQMYLLNVWGSWCPGCRIEHPMVTEFARQNIIPVYGLNYKDKENDAKRWLQQFGNPYKDILVDADGLVGIDFGVYGAPETFLIDADGIIRHKIVGELTPQKIQQELLPLIRKYK